MEYIFKHVRLLIGKKIFIYTILLALGIDSLYAGKLLYVYSDSIHAAGYKSFFDSLGYPTTIIKTNQILSTNLSQFDAIVACKSSSSNPSWGTDTASIAALKNSGKPFLSMGDGGLRLMDKFGNWAGWLQSIVDPNATSVYVSNRSSAVFNFPNKIAMPIDSVLMIYTGSFGGQGLYIGSGVPATVIPLGSMPAYKIYAPIAIEKSKYFYWGFNGPASALTAVGKALLANAIASLFVEPQIQKIVDVPNDNGKQVFVIWNASSKEGDSAKPVMKYSLWRKDSTWWTFAGEVPAKREFQYAAIVPTIFDSTKTKGTYWSKYKVIAHWQDPTMIASSQIDSGFSLDNLPPLAPTGATSYPGNNGGWVISWKPAQGQLNDFKQYAVYRSKIVGGIPGSFAKLVDAYDTVFTDKSIENNATYIYRVVSVDYSGNESSPAEIQAKVTTVSDSNTLLPANFSFSQNFPNPFNPSTTLRYGIPERSTVRLTVYNTLGQNVAQVYNGMKNAGYYEHTFDATNLPSGIYLYRIEAVSEQNPSKIFVNTKKMILMK